MYKSSINHRIKSSSLIRKLLYRDSKEKRVKFYLERFREHRQTKLSKNIAIQFLPLLFVLALFYILSSQNLYFGTVLSGSMEPSFKRGDLVLMQSLYGEPGIGDIVMFSPEKGREPVTHRIISIEENGYIKTKGDANQKEDNWRFKKGSIIGKAVIIGKKPVVIQGLGSTLVSRAGNFEIIKEVTKERGMTSLFREFRNLVPMLLFFMVIIYILITNEIRTEGNRRFAMNRKIIKR